MAEKITVEEAKRRRAARESATAKPAAKSVKPPARRLIPWEETVAAEVERDAWLINGLLPSEGLAVLYGRWKSYKSFVALDLAVAVASNGLWASRETKPGAVIYVAGEGAQGMRKRIRAYALHRDLHDLPFYTLEGRLNLGGVGAQEGGLLVAAIKAQLGSTVPVLIIMDTLSRMLVGGDENGDGMRAFTDACEALVAEFHCLVLAVHHEGANVEAKRPRGSTVLPGAVVSTWKVVKTTNGSAYACDVIVEDAKDSDSGMTLHAVLERVGLDNDPEGESTLIVERVEPKALEPETPASELRARRTPPTMRALLEAFEQALHDKGETVQPFKDGPRLRSVDLEIVRPIYYAMRADDLTEGSRRTVFARHVRNAVDRQDIITRVIDGRVMVWRGEKAT